MWITVFLSLLFIKNGSTSKENLLLNNSNCSLSFRIQTIYQSNTIQTDFPLYFRADYDLTCFLGNLTAYYKITPLAILVVGKYKNPDEHLKSMIELNSTRFFFSINQSSTIRLCILSSNDNDDDHDGDTDYRICRQIHIGINTLYEFWSLPMKVFYIGLLCSITIYYCGIFLREKWRQGLKRRAKRVTSIPRVNLINKKRDTFENEKVNEDEASDDD